MIYVENLQIGFSKVKSIQDALNLCGEGTEIEYNAGDLLKKISIEKEEDKEELDHALTTIKKLRDVIPIENGCETTRRVYIDPVLVAAARISKDFKLEVERKVVAPQAHGESDYLFKHKDRVVCVTEGKLDQHDKGVIQNISQLSAVRYESTRNRKSENEDDSGGDSISFFGIATTYLTWQVTALENKKVKVSPLVSIGSTYMDKDVKAVVELVAGVLDSAKGTGN